MNFELFEEAAVFLDEKDLPQAIARIEAKLAALPATAFHAFVGRNLLHQAEAVCAWLQEFYAAVSATHQVAVLYVELNGFVENTDEWHLHGFAYKQRGTLDDLDWLGEWQPEMSTPDPLPIIGTEDLQQAFEDGFQADELTETEEAAQDIAELLVILRTQELLVQAHRLARQRGLAWGTLPLLATAHGYDLVYETI